MSKCFRKGFKYVFTKKKFIKDAGYNRYMNIYTKLWVDICNGQIVEIVNSSEGEIGEMRYEVYPEWCKCIGREKDE